MDNHSVAFAKEKARMKRALSVFMFVLLLVSMLTIAFKVQPAKSEAAVSRIELKYQTSHSSPRGWIYVLVETSLFGGIEASLIQYAKDLEFIDGFSVRIYTVSTDNATAIRSFLQQALPIGLVGCLLVGDIPEAYYEYANYESGTHIIFQTDLYFMDLDGVWNDTDGNGWYDTHSGEVCAEIWVGSLKPSMVYGDDILLLNNYFRKNHLYRTGELTLPRRALIDLDVYDGWGELFVDSIRAAYEDIVLVNDDEATVASDYRERLLEGYEWIYLASHGSPGSHTFELHGDWDGSILGTDYRYIDPHTFFYIYNVCFTTAGYNSVAGSAIFADTYGLLFIGSRDSADTSLQTHQYREEFYEALSEGKCIGEAYLEDIRLYEDMRMVDPEYKIPGVEYGWQIVGDPSLHISGTASLHESDVNRDGKIDVRDVAMLSSAFGSYAGHPRWNIECDVNQDGRIDVADVARTSRNFGWYDPLFP
ncbi:dockerin type I domain-containing protein [Candidatus Bathyarchaeota archaeon]|nr:dockerin type I domain-containing protein [Candidatus Bathyarchaeota archaeon]